MRQLEGEARVKALQKQFLSWTEDSPVFEGLDPGVFNEIRNRTFRFTFNAFRLGIVGLDNVEGKGSDLWRQFFGWLLNIPDVARLPEEHRLAIQAKCFVVTLGAFRSGAMVNREE